MKAPYFLVKIMQKTRKIIKRRQYETGDKLCEHPLLNHLYRARHIHSSADLSRALNQLCPPHLLKNMQQAVDLLITLREKQQHIVIVGDFDADGATSTALSMSALQQLGFKNLSYIIPDRFEQGYGLSVSVAKVALAQGAECVMTVDNGVSSLDGVNYLKKHGVKVLITDHHLPGEHLPPADAIINPNLKDCPFPSKALAGVGVAFYLMLALRAKLREMGVFNQETQPNFLALLDLVALGTIADVVALDKNNRILAYQGLARIQKGLCRPGIRALVEVARRNLQELSASDLGFAIAPRLNAAGRLDNMGLGVDLLLCEDMQKARAMAYELDELNQTRREIESGMKDEAVQICKNLSRLQDNIPFGIAIYQADWHQGVLGIVASRIKDKYYRPTVAFAKEQEGILRGSARSIDGVHIRDVLERIHSQHPEMMVKFGGHAMAAGLSLRAEFLDRFQKIFNDTIKNWIHPEQLQGIIWSDGELSCDQLNLSTAELLKNAGPWGQAFPEPVFDGEFHVLQQRLLKDAHLKLMVEPKNGGPLLDAIMFNIDRDLYPDFSIKNIRLAYKLDINEFRGNRSVQLLLEHIEPLTN